MLVILGASLVGHLPISAVQILWVNLVTDSGPALALAVDPAPPGLMSHPPRKGPIIGRAMLALVAGVGALIAAIVLATFFHRPERGGTFETARTMTFTALVAQEYLRLVAIRIHERASLGWPNRGSCLRSASAWRCSSACSTPRWGSSSMRSRWGSASWAVIGVGLAVGLPAALGITRLVRRLFGPL